MRVIGRSKLAFFALGIVGLYALVGFLVVPIIIKTVVLPRLSDDLQRPITVGKVSLNPFTFSVDIENLEVLDDSARLLHIQELFANFEPSALIAGKVGFDEIRLTSPYALVKVKPDGSVNVMEVLASLASKEPEHNLDESGPSSTPPTIQVALVSITDGLLKFHDESKPTPFRANVVPINVAVRDFSTNSEHRSSYTVSVGLNRADLLHVEGNVMVAPPRSDGRISVTALDLRTVAAYVQDQLPVELTDGTLSLHGMYVIEADRDPLQAKITAGSISLNNLAVSERDGGQELLAVPSFTVQGIDFNLEDQKLVISAVESKDAQFNVWRLPDGKINYEILTASASSEKETPTDEDVPESETKPLASSDDSAMKPWDVQVGDVTFDNYNVAWTDHSLDTPAKLEINPIRLHLTDYRMLEKTPVEIDLALTLNETGNVYTSGMIGLGPLEVDLDMKMSDLALEPFQPYIDSFANIQLSGRSSVEGHLHYAAEPVDGPRARFSGTAALNDLRVIDTTRSTPVLTWDVLKIHGLDLELEPTIIAVDTIALEKPFAHVMIAADRTLNLASLVKSADEPDSQPPEQPSDVASGDDTQAPMTPVTIKAIRLVNGSVQFADFSLEPAVDTRIDNLNGAVTGLSSQEIAKADVVFDGTVNGQSPVTVRGQINPLTSNAYTDITVTFTNAELTAVSPYAAKFMGYPIEKGKLSLELAYKVAEHELIAENNVVLDQLTLGERAEDSEAPPLPMKLALALLKDRHGRIDIDLPIRGNLDDPEFRYGPLVWQVLGNVITKAATAPFAALGNLLGGDSDTVDQIGFSPGDATLSSTEEEKLTSLAEALAGRPNLRLDVAGTVDSEVDGRAIADMTLERKLREKRWKELQADGQSVASTRPEDMTLDDADYRRLLQDVYRQTGGTAVSVSEHTDRIERDSETNVLSDIEPGELEKNPSWFGKIVGFMFGSKTSDDVRLSDSGETSDEDATNEMRAGASSEGVSLEVAKDAVLKTIVVEDAQLHRLAQERATRIRDFLIGSGSITADRIFLLDGNTQGTANGPVVASSLVLSAK